jgi:hypothetical protein
LIDDAIDQLAHGKEKQGTISNGGIEI